MSEYSDTDKSDCSPTVYEEQENNIDQIDMLFQSYLKLNSNISKQYPRLRSYQQIEDQLYKTGVPRNITTTSRQTTHIQILGLEKQINDCSGKIKDLLKRFKLIIKQISKNKKYEFNQCQLMLINKYCFSINTTVTQLRNLFGFQATKNQNNKVIWIQQQGFDNINQVFLSTIDSFQVFSIITNRKGTRKQNLELIQSITPLRDFILNPFKQI